MNEQVCSMCGARASHLTWVWDEAERKERAVCPECEEALEAAQECDSWQTYQRVKQGWRDYLDHMYPDGDY